MSCYVVTMTSFCSQRGEGVKKGQKIAVILNDIWPLIVSSLCLLSVLVMMVYHTSRDIYFIVIFCIFLFFRSIFHFERSIQLQGHISGGF